MKMLFFSADKMEVTHVGDMFKEAGILFEIRHAPTPGRRRRLTDTELWIRDDRDCNRAFMLCVQLGIGFARHPHIPNVLDLDAGTEALQPEETLEAEEGFPKSRFDQRPGMERLRFNFPARTRRLRFGT